MANVISVEEEKSVEEQLIELGALLREAEDEQAGIDRLANRIARFMTQAALEEFPDLKQMTAEQIREFGETVSRASTGLALKAASLASLGERAPEDQ